MSLDTEGFKKFVQLSNRKKELENEVTEIEQEMKELAPFLVENLETNEMTKISISGKCCYIKVSSFAKISDKEKAIEILKKNGYGDYIKEGYNANSVSKLVRDLMAEDGELPTVFGETITIGSRTDLSVIAA